MSNQFQYPFNPINWPAVPHDFTGDLNLGIYTKETTQRYVYGTRYLTWDGRVYKYMGVTTNGVTSYAACCAKNPHQTPWTAAVATDAGSRTMIVTDATVVTVDQLAGGMIMVYDATTMADSQHIQIVGNELGNTTNYKIYLEFPLPFTTTGSDKVEVFENPYRLVEGSAVLSNDFSAWLGIPMVTAATTYKVWVQTWGPCISTPGNQTLDDPAGGERQVFFSPQGTLMEVADTGSRITAAHSQSAGYILNQGASSIAGPQIYLMCST